MYQCSPVNSSNISNMVSNQHDPTIESKSPNTSPVSENIILRKSCLDKKSPGTEKHEARRGHKVTFNDENLVTNQHIHESAKCFYTQQVGKISKPLLIYHKKDNKLEKLALNIKSETGLIDQIQRSEEEWDNPFLPEGEVSQEADLMLQLWRDGRHITEENLNSFGEETKENTHLELNNESETVYEKKEVNYETGESSDTTDGLMSDDRNGNIFIDCPTKKIHEITSVVIKKSWFTSAQLLKKNILSLNSKRNKENNYKKEHCTVM